MGNFSGVTVEKVEGFVKYKGYTFKITDLPGTYSLTAYSPEEVVAREFIIENKPDVVINVVDGSNLQRNLFFTTQLMELQHNFIICLNMMDEVNKSKTVIDFNLLEQLLGTHIIPVSAKNRTGINELLDHVIDVFEDRIKPEFKFHFQDEIQIRFQELTNIISQDKELALNYNTEWLAIKLLENDRLVYKMIKERPVWIKVMSYLSETNKFIESTLGEDAETLITENRYAFVKGALKEAVKFTEKPTKSFTEVLDLILINRITGIPVFLFFMWLMFQLVFKVGEYPMGWIESFFNWLGMLSGAAISDPMIRSMVVDGIISGVGGVIVFLPNIMLLFIFLAFLEGTGYMARAAFVIDKVMHTFGLHGKSAISMITGFGCSVPAFMSTRTLKSNSDRITTMLIIPFMSCGAKLPVYILIIGAFFSTAAAGNVLFGIYLFGIMMALLSAKMFKLTLFKGKSEPFVMELPPYRMPSLRYLLYQMWQKAASYLKKAASIILIASLIIWLGTNFPKNEAISLFADGEIHKIESKTELSEAEKELFIEEIRRKESADQMKYSVIGRIGTGIEPIMKPMGFDWRISISLVTGLAAKEIVVSTMATLFAMGETDESNFSSLQQSLRNEPGYNIATAIAILLFVLLYVPCIAATAVFHKEAAKWKYTLLYIGFSTVLAYLIALAGYQITLFFI